jgi:hypothetical protein
MLIGLLPLMGAQLSAPIHDRVVASDASEVAAGVVCTALTPELHGRMWSLCSTWARGSLQAIARCHPEAFADGVLQTVAQSYSTFYSSVSAASWSTIVAKAWRETEHIIALELRSALLAIHWLLSCPSSHSSRVYLLVDFMMTFFSLWKGRSSSARLLPILRKVSAMLLVSGMSLAALAAEMSEVMHLLLESVARRPMRRRPRASRRR